MRSATSRARSVSDPGTNGTPALGGGGSVTSTLLLRAGSGGECLLARGRGVGDRGLGGGLAEHPQREDEEADAAEQQRDAHHDREGRDAFSEVGRVERR